MQEGKSQHQPRTLVITGSGFHGQCKLELLAHVGKLGASYSGSLVKDYSTHLVCNHILDSFGTAKYVKALEWGIPIVSYEWVLESVQAGRALPVQDYKDDQQESLWNARPSRLPPGYVLDTFFKSCQRKSVRKRSKRSGSRSPAVTEPTDSMPCGPGAKGPKESSGSGPLSLSPATFDFQPGPSHNLFQFPGPSWPTNPFVFQATTHHVSRQTSQLHPGNGTDSSRANRTSAHVQDRRPEVKDPIGNKQSNDLPSTVPPLHGPCADSLPERDVAVPLGARDAAKSVTDSAYVTPMDHGDDEVAPETQMDFCAGRMDTPDSLVKYLRSRPVDQEPHRLAEKISEVTIEDSDEPEQLLDTPCTQYSSSNPSQSGSSTSQGQTPPTCGDSVHQHDPKDSRASTSPSLCNMGGERHETGCIDGSHGGQRHNGPFTVSSAQSPSLLSSGPAEGRGCHSPVITPPIAVDLGPTRLDFGKRLSTPDLLMGRGTEDAQPHVHEEVEDSDEDEEETSNTTPGLASVASGLVTEVYPDSEEEEEEEEEEEAINNEKEDVDQMDEHSSQGEQGSGNNDSSIPNAAGGSSPLSGAREPDHHSRGLGRKSNHGDQGEGLAQHEDGPDGGHTGEPPTYDSTDDITDISDEEAGLAGVHRPEGQPMTSSAVPIWNRDEREAPLKESRSAAVRQGNQVISSKAHQKGIHAQEALSLNSPKPLASTTSLRSRLGDVVPEHMPGISIQSDNITSRRRVGTAPTLVCPPEHPQGFDKQKHANKPVTSSMPVVVKSESVDTGVPGPHYPVVKPDPEAATPELPPQGLEDVLQRTIHKNHLATLRRQQVTRSRVQEHAQVRVKAEGTCQTTSYQSLPESTVTSVQYQGTGETDDEFVDQGDISRRGTKDSELINKTLSKHLAHLSQAGAEDQVVALKVMTRPARGNGVKEYHQLASIKGVQFAEQVQVPWAHATFSTKEKSRCAIIVLRNDDDDDDDDGPTTSTAGQGRERAHEDREPIVGEPYCFYKLTTGCWWMEYYRFFNSRDLKKLVGDQKMAAIRLPADFQHSQELLRNTERHHVPLHRVKGEIKITKAKKAPGPRTKADKNFYWRFVFDVPSVQVLSDRPATDFVVQ